MYGPSLELRGFVTGQMDELRGRDQRLEGEGGPDEELGKEAYLTGILRTIETELEADLETEDREPESELAAIDAWAGIASYAVARFYAPASPWPHRLAGWAAQAPQKLREIAHKLRRPLERVAQALAAASWSVSVGFPWGISIGVGWS